jgi:hypothetical protein
MALNKTTRNAIDDSAITTEKIEDGAITAGKFAAGDLSISKTLLLNAAPTITSLNTSQINPDSGATVTITGTGFVSIPDVRFLNTSTGARIQASTVGFTSSTTLTAAFPSGQTVGTYKVLVENPDGKGVISTSTITYSAAPVWSTAANLGSIEEGEAVNIQLLAYDDDSTAVSSYSLQSGSLPSGVTLSGDSSVGSLTGTAPAVDADTNYTFTIRATDDEGQTSDREFTLTVTNWTVANSLRFDDGSSDSLSRTSGTPTSTEIFTFSCWIKRSVIGRQRIFTVSDDPLDNDFSYLELTAGHALTLSNRANDGATVVGRTSNNLLRDSSAWYHIVVSGNVSSGVSNANKAKMYINGVEVSYAGQDNGGLTSFTILESGKKFVIGQNSTSTSYTVDGYMAEVVFIDGQQLTPSSFGETDTASGIWKPKQISGLTFGNNGFYLPFTNSASLGADSSGNSNDFTVNNLKAIDQTTDTPINNFLNYNSLEVSNSSGRTFSDGNTSVEVSSGNLGASFGTFGVNTGKWYYEVKIISQSGAASSNGKFGTFGFHDIAEASDAENDGLTIISDARLRGQGSTGSAIGSPPLWGVGDILMFALDMDNQNLYMGKNGSWRTSAGAFSDSSPTDAIFTSISTSKYWTPFGQKNVTADNTLKWSINSGNPPFTISSGNSDANGYGNFEYAVPSGYFALNTKNLAEYG